MTSTPLPPKPPSFTDTFSRAATHFEYYDTLADYRYQFIISIRCKTSNDTNKIPKFLGQRNETRSINFEDYHE